VAKKLSNASHQQAFKNIVKPTYGNATVAANLSIAVATPLLLRFKIA